MYRIMIDRSLCSGFGACAELAPEIFEVDGERRRRRSAIGTTDDPAVARRGRRPARWARSPSIEERGGMTPRTVVIVGRRARRRPRRRDAAPRASTGRVVLVGEEPVRAVRAARALEGVPRRHARRGVAAAPQAAFWDERGIELVLGDARRARSTRRAVVRTSSRPRARVRRARRSRPAPGRGGCRSSCPRRARAADARRRARAARRARARHAPRRRRRRLRRRRGRVDGARRSGVRRDDRRGRRRAARARARRTRSGCCSPRAGAHTASTCASHRRRAHPHRTPPAASRRSGSPTAPSFAPTPCSSASASSRHASSSRSARSRHVHPAGDVVGPGALDGGRARRRGGGAADPRPAGARTPRTTCGRISSACGSRSSARHPGRHDRVDGTVRTRFAAPPRSRRTHPLRDRRSSRRTPRHYAGRCGASVVGVKADRRRPVLSGPSSSSPRQPPRSRSTSSSSAARRIRASPWDDSHPGCTSPPRRPGRFAPGTDRSRTAAPTTEARGSRREVGCPPTSRAPDSSCARPTSSGSPRRT